MDLVVNCELSLFPLSFTTLELIVDRKSAKSAENLGQRHVMQIRRVASRKRITCGMLDWQ